MVRASLVDLAIVLAGGGLGAVARWLLSGALQEALGWYFPVGTLAVNVLGSALLGFVMGASAELGVFTREQRLFLAAGFAGSFTTFSTMEYELLVLLRDSPWLGAAFLAASVVLGLLAVYIGYAVAILVYG